MVPDARVFYFGHAIAGGQPMPEFAYDHIHLRSPDPEATAAFYERIFGAQILRSMQNGKPRIDLKLGGVDVFIAPVTPDSGVNPPPVTPYQGSIISGCASTTSTRWSPSSRPRACISPWSRPRSGLACVSL